MPAYSLVGHVVYDEERARNWVLRQIREVDAMDDLTAEDLQESAKRAAEKMVAPGNWITPRESFLAMALLTAARSSTRSPFYDVVGFGGSFGTHVPLFLTIARDVPFEWTIIEQDLLVNVGRAGTSRKRTLPRGVLRDDQQSFTVF